ncbi:MAG: DUF4091 domain-containing protein [Candidatus Merdivicinus sp.]
MIHQLKVLSSLEKVFPDQCPQEYSGQFSMLRCDQLSFQIAYQIEAAANIHYHSLVKAAVQSPLAPWLNLTQVVCVPSRYPVSDSSDGNYLRTKPGLYPDLLRPFPEEGVRIPAGEWNAVWVQILSDSATPAGRFPVTVTLTVEANGNIETYEKEVTVEVIPAELPKQKLVHTEWFHGDCIADYYHVPVWSEEHWKLLEGQIRTAAKYGVNMLLTPVFTPALDTRIGGERTTIQLVDIKRENGSYSFGFDKLDRWVAMCRSCGIEFFEIAHLYTQWGAKHCPKIMATDNGEYRRIFGWESDAVSPEYRTFLEAFLPALTAELSRIGLEKRQVVFHISDEPSTEALPQYEACKEQVKHLLEGYTIMDALSDFSFYQQGVCTHPVVATDHVNPFLENQVPGLWVYYCCGQGNRVSNRFMAMPSARNRIIGLQFYKYQIAGFLQWGFNFYNTMHSVRHIDPFAVTDADCAFPSGDAFLVYPGDDGQPWDSIRIRIFFEAINDLRALELLESLAGREFVMNLMEGSLSKEITFFEYPQEASYLLNLRSRINCEIQKRI